jgi:hypothetical protein
MIQATHTNGVHHPVDAELDHLYAWMPPQGPAPQPCPEALFSLTLKGYIDGHEALLTARGQTPAEFKANLEQIRGLLDARPQPQTPVQPLSPQQHNAAAMHKRVSDFCPVHNVAMTLNTKDGRSWYSHRKPEGGFCKGR